MNSRIPVSAALALGGCAARHALDEVPLKGGSAEQRAAIQEELDQFERWIGAGRVRLSEIEVSRNTGGRFRRHAGLYNPVAARIVVSGALAPTDASIVLVLRHELCHAVEMQEDMLDHAVPAFDLVAAAVDRDEDHPLHGNIGTTPRRKRGEVFAFVCQEAPLGTTLLSRPCPGESDEYAEVAAFVARESWTGSPDVVRDRAWTLSSPVGPWKLPFEVARVDAIGSQAHGAVRLRAVSERSVYQAAAVSTVDGSEAPPFDDLGFDGIIAGYEATGPRRAPDLGSFTLDLPAPIRAVSDGGVTLRIVSGLRQPRLGVAWAPRVIAGPPDEAWSIVDGVCPGDGASVFVADGRFHVAWPEGNAVWWAPVE